MALSQAEVDALKAAIATGVRKVAYSDRTVEYHSLKEMIDALAFTETEASAVEGATARATFASFRRD